MKKRIRTWIAVLLLTCVSCVHIGGCMVSTDSEGRKHYSIDSRIAKQVEDGTDTAISIMTLLSPTFPFLAPIVAAAGTGLIAWRKMKPKLTEAQEEATMYHSIASSAVIAIENFKKAYPKEWDSLLERLEKVKTKMIKPEDRLKIENLIRGLRGLPPKV